MSDTREKEIQLYSELDIIGRNLSKLAEQNRIGPIYEREEYIQSMAALLALREGSILLVGEPGVGKNAIVEGYTNWIARNKEQEDSLSATLSKRYIYEVSIISFQANCMYVHDFETRIKRIVDNCRRTDSVLFFDNINMAIRAGGVEGHENRTIANLLLPFLSENEMQIIGATTPLGLSVMLKTNPSFTRQFKIIEIPPTDKKETFKIIQGLMPKYEQKYSIILKKDAIHELIDLSDRFFKWRYYPGKAFEILSDIISTKKSNVLSRISQEQGFILREKGKDKTKISYEVDWSTPNIQTEITQKENDIINDKDVFVFLKHTTGLPYSIIYPSDVLRKEKIQEYFLERIIGQDNAIESIVDTILRFKAEIQDPEKPLGVFLFVGPTGVGNYRKFLFMESIKNSCLL